jgi:hypothetical protein
MDTDLIEPSYVMVVNRTGQTMSFMGFGRLHTFAPHEERAITRVFAEWVFTRMNGPMLCHTEEQGYTHWLGIKAGSDELVSILPENVFDTSPLTPFEALEGWDTSVVNRSPARMGDSNVKQVPLLRADFSNQGGALGSGVLGAPAKVKG